jgi:hypothetical protein
MLAGEIDDADMNKFEIAVTTALGEVPFIGDFISALVEMFWPSNQVDPWTQIKDKVENLIDEKIAAADYARVQAALGDASLASGLIGELNDYQAVVAASTDLATLKAAWAAANAAFITASGAFEQKNLEVLLLPLWAQMANMHMALLRDGVILDPALNTPELQKYLKIYVRYAQTWTAKAVADEKAKTWTDSNQPPTTYTATWSSIKRIERFFQLSVLNFAELWPSFADVSPTPQPPADLWSKTEIYYTLTEAVHGIQWPYGLDYTAVPTTPQADISEIVAYAVWDDGGADLCLPTGSTVTYSNSVSTPYSGVFNQGLPVPPPNAKPGRWKNSGSLAYFYDTVRPTTANPITAVEGKYESGGGPYYYNFRFKDGTSTGDLPGQAGSGNYASLWKIVPPKGYVLSSLYTAGGGWYGGLRNVIFGFRMAY